MPSRRLSFVYRMRVAKNATVKSSANGARFWVKRWAKDVAKDWTRGSTQDGGAGQHEECEPRDPFAGNERKSVLNEECRNVRNNVEQGGERET